MQRKSERNWIIETAEQIVSAGLDPTRWALIPDAFITRFPGTSVLFESRDAQTRMSVGLMLSGDVSAQFVQDYTTHYSSLNPWVPFWLAAPTMCAFVSDHVAPSATFRNTEFYQDWLAPARCQSAVGLKLFAEKDRGALLAVHYGPARAQTYNASVASAVHTLGPVLKAAVSLNRHLAEQSAAERTIVQIIETLARPAFVVDRNASIRIANGLGAAWLEREKLLTVDGRIRLVGPRLIGSFARLLQAIIAGESHAADLPLRTEDGRLHAILTLQSIAGASSVPGSAWLFAPERLVLVLVRQRAGVDSLVDADLLRRIFGITAAEARLAQKMASGMPIDAAADALGVAKETARSQLKQVFAKTETHRQSELVALLARLARRP